MAQFAYFLTSLLLFLTSVILFTSLLSFDKSASFLTSLLLSFFTNLLLFLTNVLLFDQSVFSTSLLLF